MIFQTLSRKSQKPWSITRRRRECCRAQWWHSGQPLLKLGNSCCTRFGENDHHCFVWCRHLYNFHLPYWKYFHNKTDQWPPEWSDSISLALSAYLVFKLSKTKMEKANNQLKFIGRSKQNIWIFKSRLIFHMALNLRYKTLVLNMNQLKSKNKHLSSLFIK